MFKKPLLMSLLTRSLDNDYYNLQPNSFLHTDYSLDSIATLGRAIANEVNIICNGIENEYVRLDYFE